MIYASTMGTGPFLACVVVHHQLYILAEQFDSMEKALECAEEAAARAQKALCDDLDDHGFVSQCTTLVETVEEVKTETETGMLMSRDRLEREKKCSFPDCACIKYCAVTTTGKRVPPRDLHEPGRE